MNKSTSDIYMNSYHSDLKGLKYNYCPYGFKGICIDVEKSQCLLSKCYHDMESSELAEFRTFWFKTRKWFNECNYNGNGRTNKQKPSKEMRYIEEHYEEISAVIPALGTKETLKRWNITRSIWYKYKKERNREKDTKEITP